jgi:peptidoglycan-associated lipoprotein
MRTPAASSRRAALVIAAIAGMFILTTASGCGKKTPESTYDEAAAGMGESDLGGGSGSSLDQFRSGRLGSGGYGPLDDILFGYDSTSLTEEARDTLNQNAEWLRANPSARVELEGHCDNRGTVEYNLALGARRATSARDYLVSLGIAPERLTTISYGEELPLCQEETEDCWARNRRVHFAVLS